MAIKAIKPGMSIRPAIKPAIKPAATAPVVEQTDEEVIEQAVAEEQLGEEQLGAEGEEQLGEELDAVEQEEEQEAAPVATKPTVKPAAKPTAVAAKPAAVKPAAKPAAAAPAPKAAAKAAAKPAAKPAAAAPAAKAKAPTVLGEVRKFQVELPEELGARITVDNVQELFFQYLNAHAADLGFAVPTKAMAARIMESVFKFLIGDSPEAEIEGTVESITKNGGLAVLFEAKLMEGVHFKHTVIGDRKYRNPRSQSPEDAYVRVQGRRSIGMNLQIDPGTTSYEAE